MVVFEEDTYRVMSASPRIAGLPETTGESLDEVAAFTPHDLGDLIVSGNRCFAIVHDFDNDPSFDRDAADRALEHLARLAVERGVQSVAIQALGRSAGEELSRVRFRIETFLSGTPVRRVWLIVG